MTHTNTLDQRLRAMANHPMAIFDREWTEVRDDLRAAGEALAALRSPAPSRVVALALASLCPMCALSQEGRMDPAVERDDTPGWWSHAEVPAIGGGSPRAQHCMASVFRQKLRALAPDSPLQQPEEVRP